MRKLFRLNMGRMASKCSLVQRSSMPLLVALTFLCCYALFQLSGAASETGSIKAAPSAKDRSNAEIQATARNLPFEFWLREKNRINEKKNACANYPSIFDVKYNNIYWQTFHSSNGTFYLYGAYHDNRAAVRRPVIRIVGMIDRIEPAVKAHCLLWYDAGRDPIVSPIVDYSHVWHRSWGYYKQGVLQPYVMACYLPDKSVLVQNGFPENAVPISVSITEKGCEQPTNNLKVHNEVPKKKGRFAVCVKGLDFLHQDISVRLVEWIELLGLLGAEKIFVYEFDVHPNISKMLRYYQETGQVDVTPLTLPGDQPNIPGLRHLYFKSKIAEKRVNEVIPYNDCLYRNLYSYDYVVVLDTDEVIMPKNEQTWGEFVDAMAPKFHNTPSSYSFRNVYFWEDVKPSKNCEANIPPYMHMLQHVYRSHNYTKPGHYIKCIHDVQKVKTLHNHFPRACFGKGCSSYEVSTEVGQMQHYRDNCVIDLKDTCESDFKRYIVKDTNIWRFKKDLIQRVDQVLGKLGFFNSKGEVMGVKCP